MSSNASGTKIHDQPRQSLTDEDIVRRLTWWIERMEMWQAELSNADSSVSCDIMRVSDELGHRPA